MNSISKTQFIESIISKMSLEEKIGQCLVIGFVGTMITPEILHRIRSYHPAGVRTGLTFRIKTAVHDPTAVGNDRFADRVVRHPKGTVKDFKIGLPLPHITNEEYCELLNTMKQEAMKSGASVPLHFTLDMEGDLSNDYNRGSIHYFPSCMGLTLDDDPELAKQVAWAVARQVSALGFNWIHSPVVDVNTNPFNPEIGTRAYGEDEQTVTRFALKALEGFREGKLIATAKHYPGRGESATDAHDGLPEIPIQGEELQKHLYPYRKLIEAGLPAIMSAHSSYPALDPTGESASLSKPICTELLRNELGFKGVLTTDDITMGGIIQKYEVPDAVIEAIKAGNDLVLIRDESPLIHEVFPVLVKSVEQGKISAEQIEQSIRRTLSVKYDYGLFDDGNIKDPTKASDGINDPEVIRIEQDAAKRAVKILRDEQKLVPLNKSKKILLIEQINPLHLMTNSQKCHPSVLWKHMLEYKHDLEQVECTLEFDQDDRNRVMRRVDNAEIIVITSYYYRNQKFDNSFVKEVIGLDKPTVVVTNTHYMCIRDEYKSVVISYGVGPENMKALAAKLFGKL